jgi:hypothetical protein
VSETVCKFCGASIQWARIDGTWTAMDAKEQVYLLVVKPGTTVADAYATSGFVRHAPLCKAREARREPPPAAESGRDRAAGRD